MKLSIGNYASYLVVRKLEENEFVDLTKEIAGGVYADYDVDGNIVGIEFLTEIKPEYYDEYKAN
jgi:uncharacterized protein YuzE